jgi:glycosyltransferase involved in cell wall biosynthesis
MASRQPADVVAHDRAVFLVDTERGSYERAADLYFDAFHGLGIEVERVPYADAPAQDLRGRWVVHHTIGPLFRPVAGAINTAVVFHEWSRYPSGWIGALNTFDALWAPSRHVERVLTSSGATVPVCYAPPPLAVPQASTRAAWHATGPFRLLSVGEPHFRKGFHLLIEGFQRAFPQVGEAELTLKVSPSCDWSSPRRDIHLVRERLPRPALQELFITHDAYVTASLGEGLGLPVAEAVTALLPVAANRWGGHGEIVEADAFWDIAYDEVPQLYCSHPTFYADGQQCAYSSPEHIADTLRAMVAATPGEREARARRAHAHLSRTHGLAAATERLRAHVPAVRR